MSFPPAALFPSRRKAIRRILFTQITIRAPKEGERGSKQMEENVCVLFKSRKWEREAARIGILEPVGKATGSWDQYQFENPRATTIKTDLVLQDHVTHNWPWILEGKSTIIGAVTEVLTLHWNLIQLWNRLCGTIPREKLIS